MTCKDGKSHFSGLAAGESSSLQQRQKRLQEHGKERRELLSKGTFQVLGNTAKLGSGGLPFPVIFFMLGSKTNASIPTKLLECCSNQLYQRLISAVNQLLPLSDYFCVPGRDSVLTFQRKEELSLVMVLSRALSWGGHVSPTLVAVMSKYLVIIHLPQ